MCGGGGGGGSEAIDYQREQDELRKKQIAQGKQQLERIFAGLEGDSYQQVNPSNLTDLTPEQFQQQVSDILANNLYTTQRQGTYRTFHEGGHSDGFNGGGSFNFDYQQLADPGRNALLDLGFTAQQIQDANLEGALGKRGSSGIGSNRNYYNYGGAGAASDASQSLDVLKQVYTDTMGDPGKWTRVEGTGTPIWEQQQQAYMDYANPQLQDQYADAQKSLTYALARQGQLAGSLSGDRFADLSKDYKLQQQQVADTARGYANQAKQNIADQKQSLLQMLNATADVGGTTDAARASLNSLKSTPSFTALGPLFQNATAGLGAYATQQQNAQQQKRLNQIAYGGDPDKGSGRTIS